MMFKREFDWDTGNLLKCQKHGLAQEEIEAFFLQEPLFVSPDLNHSHLERRFYALGKAHKGKRAIVVFTIRDERIRPISARYMHEKEIRRFKKDYPSF